MAYLQNIRYVKSKGQDGSCQGQEQRNYETM